MTDPRPERELTPEQIAEIRAEYDAWLEQRSRSHRACSCPAPDPVMQADGKFYCHVCSFETGARPTGLEPEILAARLHALAAERDALLKRISDHTRGDGVPK